MAETEADKHIFCNNFKCDLSEDLVKISSINMTIPKISTSTGQDTAQKTFRPGRPTFGNITFQGAEHTDGVKKIRTWIKTAYDGGDARKDMTVEIHNQKGEVVRTFNLYRCLPVAYSSIDFNSQGGAATMHWVVEVRVQRIEMK
jgi:phage tail-like protein